MASDVNRAFSAGVFWGANNPGTVAQACVEWSAVGTKYLPDWAKRPRSPELLRIGRLCKIEPFPTKFPLRPQLFPITSCYA
jgi:hypothetical protein